MKSLREKTHVHVALVSSEPVEGRPEDEETAIELLSAK